MTKDEILYKTFPEKANYITEAGQKKMRQCMDEFAQQQATAFAEFILNNRWQEANRNGGVLYWVKYGSRPPQVLTSQELYQLFISQTNV